ncbi:MAG: hypothetical protein HY322_00805 [Betaproteobacteria bacterium]|nr:hypothetical protein [Betaproteobacteria bacterium]
MNQSLYMSTDRTTSAFQFCGLSRLTPIRCAAHVAFFVLINAPHLDEEIAQRNIAAGRLDFHLGGKLGRQAETDDPAVANTLL